MRTIEQILQLLEDENIKPATFERKNELGNGYLKKIAEGEGDITNKMLERIRKNSKPLYEKLFNEEKQFVEVERPTDDTHKMIFHLLESNRILAEANKDLAAGSKDLAAANLKLVNDHGELVQLAKRVLNLPNTLTENGAQELNNKQEDHPAKKDFALDKKARTVG